MRDLNREERRYLLKLDKMPIAQQLLTAEAALEGVRENATEFVGLMHRLFMAGQAEVLTPEQDVKSEWLAQEFHALLDDFLDYLVTNRENYDAKQQSK